MKWIGTQNVSKEKNPEYDPKKILNELMETMLGLYVNTGDSKNESINWIAKEFGMSRIKARKLLITAGVYTSDTCDWINQLHNKGKTIGEIQEITHMSYAAIHSYLPYAYFLFSSCISISIYV